MSDAQGLPRGRETGIGSKVQECLCNLLSRGAVVGGHANVELQPLASPHGHERRDGDQALRSFVETWSCPNLPGEEPDHVFFEVRGTTLARLL